VESKNGFPLSHSFDGCWLSCKITVRKMGAGHGLNEGGSSLAFKQYARNAFTYPILLLQEIKAFFAFSRIFLAKVDSSAMFLVMAN
jgi:hypothetical protein